MAFDALFGLLGPDELLRLGLLQGPNMPGGGGPSPLTSGLDSAPQMPTIAGPLAAIPLAERLRLKRRSRGRSNWPGMI